MRPPIRTLATCLALAFAAPSPAQPDAKAPLDPAHVVAQFRKAYHKRPFVESLDITVRTASETRRESAVVRANIKGELRLELGDLIIWTEPARLLAVHRLNAGAFFQAPLEGPDRAAEFARVLPPLPIPQIALVLQPHDAAPSLWTVSPLAASPHWDTATAAHRAKKPAVVLAGTCEQATVRVAGVGDPPQLVFADTKSVRNDLTTTISADITRLDEPVGKLEADLRGRTRVESLTDLRPLTPDLRPGLGMPDLIAEPATRGPKDASSALTPLGKPAVIVIFRGGTPGIDNLLRSVRAQAPTPAASVRALAVCPLTDTKARAAAIALMNAAGVTGFISYSEATTLARFAPSDEQTAVVIFTDGTGLVQAILPLSQANDPATLKQALERCK